MREGSYHFDCESKLSGEKLGQEYISIKFLVVQIFTGAIERKVFFLQAKVTKENKIINFCCDLQKMAVCSAFRISVVLVVCLVPGLCLLWYYHLQDFDFGRIEKLFSWSADPKRAEEWGLLEGEFVSFAVNILILIPLVLFLSGMETKEQYVDGLSTSLNKAERIVAEGVEWAGEFI